MCSLHCLKICSEKAELFHTLTPLTPWSVRQKWVMVRKYDLKCSENKEVLDQAEWKGGKQSLEWWCQCDSGVTAQHIQDFQQLLVPLAALPRGTTWRHITFLMGRELCSAREGGILLPQPMDFAQMCFSLTVFWNKKKSMRAMEGPCLKGDVSVSGA